MQCGRHLPEIHFDGAVGCLRAVFLRPFHGKRCHCFVVEFCDSLVLYPVRLFLDGASARFYAGIPELFAVGGIFEIFHMVRHAPLGNIAFITAVFFGKNHQLLPGFCRQPKAGYSVADFPALFLSTDFVFDTRHTDELYLRIELAARLSVCAVFYFAAERMDKRPLFPVACLFLLCAVAMKRFDTSVGFKD